MDAKERVRERRIRRMAERQGYKLSRSARRDPRALDYGKYSLIDLRTRTRLFADELSNYGATLDQIEAFLTRDLDEIEPKTWKEQDND